MLNKKLLIWFSGHCILAACARTWTPLDLINDSRIYDSAHFQECEKIAVSPSFMRDKVEDEFIVFRYGDNADSSRYDTWGYVRINDRLVQWFDGNNWINDDIKVVGPLERKFCLPKY